MPAPGYRQTIHLNYVLELDEGISIDALPKSLRMINPEKTIAFSRAVMYEEKTRRLVSRITITNTKSQFDAEEYPAVHEFYKKMFDYLNEQIVIKKS
ncbi:MAG: hypothetical protein EOO00_04640 [Chitinophagaceae bacterium]|nr:MAG: hypothetical protein EOO00_04640 [Chitinophagaceae bacterium]